MEIPALVRCIHLFYTVSMPHSHGVLSSAQVAFMRIKWWTRFTVARPILLPTHQPTAHGAHTESLGATHPVARTPSSWDATGNYFQLPLPAVAQGSSDMEFRISGATQVQLAVNILLNTNSPVCACCNKLSCLKPNVKVQRFNYTTLPE